jgi:hypothetical protein
MISSSRNRLAFREILRIVWETHEIVGTVVREVEKRGFGALVLSIKGRTANPTLWTPHHQPRHAGDTSHVSHQGRAELNF